MDTEKTIDNVIFEIENESIQKRKKNPIIPIVVIILGILLVILAETIMSGYQISGIIKILGYMTGIAGITLLIINITNKGVPHYAATGEKLKRFEFTFDQSQKNDIIRYVNDGNFNSLKELPEGSSSAVKAIIYKTASDKMMLLQALEYIPHTYEPITEIKIFHKNK